jgi:hypothetical protein
MAEGSKEGKYATLKSGLITAGFVALVGAGIGVCNYVASRPYRVGERDGCEVTSATMSVEQNPDVQWEYTILTEQCPAKTTKYWLNPYTDECYDVEVRDSSGKVVVDKKEDMTDAYRRACAELNTWVEQQQKR